jgi:hypothetical protein
MAAPILLNIPEPCHENWQQMTPNEQGRHCMACQKTVVDFTLMSDQEILDHITRATSSVCGRFNNEQLNKTYAERKVKPSFTFRYVWNMLVSTFLVIGSGAMSQTHQATKGKVAVSAGAPPLKKKPSKKPTGVSRNPVVEMPMPPLTGLVAVEPRAVELPGHAIRGVVKDDSTKLPLGAVSVRIKGTETGVSTDMLGNFVLPDKGNSEKTTLIVSAIGYTTREIEVDGYQSKITEILLTPEYKELAAVEIRSHGIRSCTSIAGGVRMVRKNTLAEKIKREVNEWLPDKLVNKEVRLYPNPVVPGNSININLKLKAMGTYKLELMDASGRIVHVQALQVVQKEQLINMPTQSSWSRGIYWVRISNGADKKVYQAKVLLQ